MTENDRHFTDRDKVASDKRCGMPMIVNYGIPRIFTACRPMIGISQIKVADKSLRHADDSELRYTENIYFWHAVHDGK